MASLDVEIDLKDYIETQFVSNSATLKRIIGELKRKEKECNHALYDLLFMNHYKEFDEYISERPGRDHFYEILQQIFMFKYFLPEGKIPLTRKQIQNALGIQQARWSCDSENKDTYPVGQVKFNYYQELVPTYDSPFNRALMDYRKGGVLHEEKLYPEFLEKSEKEKLEKVFELLKDTVWYSYEEDVFLEMYHRRKPSNHFWIREPQNLYGEEIDVRYCNCFPLPESFANLCDIACLHNPELVFGALSSPTIVKYYIIHGKRPFHCQLATSESSKLNFKTADGNRTHLLSFWTHDMQHEALGNCSPDIALVRMNRKLSLFARKNLKDRAYVPLTAENIKEQFEDVNSILNLYIQHEKTSGEESTFLSITDEPGVWKNGRTQCFKGGNRKRTKRRTSKRYTRFVRLRQ